MKPWQFRQKTIGFGISKDAYWTVLAATATLPPPLVVANSKGEGGAIEGFLAPLSSGASKEDLARPLTRGGYVLTSKDRKIVVRMLVLSKEEAGFDPAPFLNSSVSQDFDPDLRARVSATWSLIQLTFETHDAFVHDSLKFMLSVCQRLAELTNGVVADPIAMTYKLPDQVFVPIPVDAKVDARDQISTVVIANRPEGSHLEHCVATHGMRKFAMPEIEIFDVPTAKVHAAKTLLFSLAQSALLGNKFGPGDRLGGKGKEFQIADGGFDKARWGGIPVYELLPPTEISVEEALNEWELNPL